MTKEELAKYNFGEKREEDGKKVYITPKYLSSKESAIEIIKRNYGVTESDFWILKTLSKNKEYVIYNGLIISHNGCLKINDKLGNKGFRSNCISEPIEFEYNGATGLRQVYKECSEDCQLYEVGEISTLNLKNAYPYAMLFKRVFDRVVLKKSKLAFFGIYGEDEAEDFSNKDEIQEDNQ